MTIRVLQLIPWLDAETGGPPVAAVETAIALQESGAQNSFAFPIDGRRPGSIADLLEALRARDIPVHVFRESQHFDAGRRWGFSLRLALWVLRNGRRFDVIHAHIGWSFTALVGLLTAKLNGSVAVLSPHASLATYDRRKSGPVKAAIKRSLRAVYLYVFDVVVVASQLELDELGRPRRARMVVVSHAVQPVAEPRRRAHNGRLRVGFLARLDPTKNLEILLDALAQLPESVTLHVAGDGPPVYRDALRARAERIGVAGRVEWRGFVNGEAKVAFLDSIDVLAMPSAFEGFGVAAVEALWAGVPVVVSNRVGVAYVVADYACGRVVEPTPAGVARAIRELAEPEARSLASAKARRAAEAEFSRAAHGERLTEAYETALRTRRGQRGRSNR